MSSSCPAIVKRVNIFSSTISILRKGGFMHTMIKRPHLEGYFTLYYYYAYRTGVIQLKKSLEGNKKGKMR